MEIHHDGEGRIKADNTEGEKRKGNQFTEGRKIIRTCPFYKWERNFQHKFGLIQIR